MGQIGESWTTSAGNGQKATHPRLVGVRVWGEVGWDQCPEEGGTVSPAMAGSQQDPPLPGYPARSRISRGSPQVTVWETTWSKAPCSHLHFDPAHQGAGGTQSCISQPQQLHEAPTSILCSPAPAPPRGCTSSPTGSPHGRQSRCSHTEQRRSLKTPLQREGTLGARPSQRELRGTLGNRRGMTGTQK